jgi:hypothetical protein
MDSLLRGARITLALADLANQEEPNFEKDGGLIGSQSSLVWYEAQGDKAERLMTEVKQTSAA